MLEDVRAGAVSPGQHRGSEQDLKQMAEVAKCVNSSSLLLQEPSLTESPSCGEVGYKLGSLLCLSSLETIVLLQVGTC